MPILSATSLGHAYGADELFDGFDIKLEAKQRVGLVGPNGCGKTTLLLILADLLEPTEGEVAREADLSVGYLRQEAVLTFRGQGNSIYEEMLTVFADLTAQERRLRELEKEMAAGNTAVEILTEYGDLQQRYETLGGYDYQVNIKRVLQGLGFPPEAWQTPLHHLSGGQKTRVLLARLLLEEPDLLILDEPTNHLDTAAIEWLERTLRFWNGTLLIVSHDRYFLDKVVNHIWELRPHDLVSYKGNYSSYLIQRQANWEREMKLFEDEMARLETELDFIRRNIAGSNTDLAKGKLKRLTRDIILLEEVGVLGREGKSWMEVGGRVRTFSANEAARRLRAIKPPSNRPPALNIRLKSEEQSEQLVLRTSRLTIGYPATPLFKTEKIRLERGDIVALLGANGSGKSTFLRTLLGDLPPLRGKVELGENVQVGYFAQAHDQLNLERRVLDEILHYRPSSEQKARTYLAQYLFQGDDVFKQVRDLSGGERGRLALAILAVTGANFLLLDEPTNHLDIPSQEVLQAVLEKYDGTIVLVSHDRYLVNQLATQIWAIEPEEAQLTVFEGSYEAYLLKREEAAQAAAEQAEREATSPSLDWLAEMETFVPPEVADDVAEVLPSAKRPKQKQKKVKSRRGASALELEIQNAEIWLDKLEQELEAARAEGDEAQIEWLEDEYDTAVRDLEELMAQLDQ